MKVLLDITGFFFEREVEVAENATVQDVMEAAKKANQPNVSDSPIFSYSDEHGFVDRISVVHRGGSAKSRQDQSRVYPDGLYSYADDGVIKSGGAFAPANPEKTIALAWQYYVYNQQFVDLNRQLSGDKGTRKIVPYSKSNAEVTLTDGSQVVWRLVALMLKPNGEQSLKSKASGLVS